MSNLAKYSRNGRLPRDPFALAREFFGNDVWPTVARDQGQVATFSPQFDVKETDTAYVIAADMPGLKEDDLEVSLTGNHLVIGGKRESEEKRDEENYHLYERRFGSFQRSFLLPEEADGDSVAANLSDGVLVVNIAKKTQAKPKKISVKKSS